MFFLVPIVAGAATYGSLTQDEAGEYQSGGGDRTIDAYQIYRQVNEGPGAGSLYDGQTSASKLRDRYRARVMSIDNLNRRMDSAWTGEGGAAANSGAHPLKIWMEDSQANLGQSHAGLEGQGAAFDVVSRSVQEVPQQPPESDFLNDITPWETDTDRAIADYNSRAQANVDAFNTYYEASRQNAEQMPTYSKVDGEFGDIKVDDSGGGDDGKGGDKDGGDGTDGGGDQGTPPGGSIPGGSSIPPGGGGSIPGGGGSIPGGGGNIPGGGGNIPGGGGSIPGGGGNIPGPGEFPGGGNHTPGDPSGGGSYRPPNWDSTGSSSYTPPGTKVPSADFSPGSHIPGSGFGGGAGGGGGFGPGGGAGSMGAMGAVGGGFGPGGPAGAGGFGPGGGSASGSGAAAPGGAAGAGAARGGAAAAGAAGGRGMGSGMMGGMGGAGRGGGQGSDDEEHQSKYLVQEDGNSLFGTDELTAPPVIGE